MTTHDRLDAPANFQLIGRRRFLFGASATLLCAPAIVRATILMQVREIVFPIERNYHGHATRMWLCWTLPAIRKYQDDGLSAHEIARTLNNRKVGYANYEPWDADGVLGVVRLDEAIKRSDAIIRAERLIL